MTKLVTKAQSWVSTRKVDEEGAALIEYGLLVGLIAVVCIAAVDTLGGSISGFFTSVNTAIAAAV